MRKTKMLGLLAVSAMALAAVVGTSSAMAEEPGTFTFAEAGEELQHTVIATQGFFTFTEADTMCQTIDFNGTTTGTSAAQQSVSPVFDECESFGFAEAEVHENGCILTFEATTSGTPGHADVNLDNCADKTKGIQVTVHVPFFATCVVDIPEQSIDRAVRYTNVNAKSLRIDWTASKIMFDVTTSTGFCPLTTGTHSGANGASYGGASTFTTAKGMQYSPVS
jgi:hypothetical protein